MRVRLMRQIAFEGPAHPHKANILKYPGEKIVVLKEPASIEGTLASESSAAPEVASR